MADTLNTTTDNSVMVHAQDAPATGNPMGGLFPIIIMFAIFYFVLIRPQQKKQKEARQMVEDLKEGDTVVTLSGIHGTIKKLKEDTVMLQIADNVRVKINRSSIGGKKD